MPYLKVHQLAKSYIAAGRWTWNAEDDEDDEDDEQEDEKTVESKAQDLKPGTRIAALKDITFEVSAGEALGVIGGAGAGKSTLMRILAGLSRADSGKINGSGKLVFMNGARTSINAHLTGRQNLKLLASLTDCHGSVLPKDSKLDAYDDAIENAAKFCRLARILDRPSGEVAPESYAKLAYALMVELKPDILLFDDVLAPGNVFFKEQLEERVRELLDQKSIVIIASRRTQLMKFCGELLWLEHGKIVKSGEIHGVLSAWQSAELLADKGIQNAEPGETEKAEDAISQSTTGSQSLASDDASELEYRQQDDEISMVTNGYFLKLQEEPARGLFSQTRVEMEPIGWPQRLAIRKAERLLVLEEIQQTRRNSANNQRSTSYLNYPLGQFGSVLAVRTCDSAGDDVVDALPGEDITVEVLVSIYKRMVEADIIMALSIGLMDASRSKFISPIKQLAIARMPTRSYFEQEGTYIVNCRVPGHLTAAMTSSFLMTAELGINIWDVATAITPPTVADTVKFKIHWIGRFDLSKNVPYGYYGVASMRSPLFCPEFDWEVSRAQET